MRYHATSGVALQAGNPPIFITPEGGVIVTDELLAELWTESRASTADEITGRFASHPDLGAILVEAVACLAEAGLLERATPARSSPSPVVHEGPLVSIVIVVSSIRELDFLGDCLQSIADSGYRPIELLLVDNDSKAVVDPLVRRHAVRARIVRLAPRRCLAAACNAAIAECDAPYALLMNPDVRLQRDAIARMVRRAEADSNVAAVVPKTLLWRTPSFLNAIGNRVPPANWGTDNAIGQLDLGQFDDWRHSPSASLTIELVVRRAWDVVGTFDESFPAYYEDADWAYRARLMGWSIAAEPAAEAFHIFGGFWDAPPEGGLSSRKLETAVVGRLRFICRNAGSQTLRTLLRRYAWEDIQNVFVGLSRGDLRTARTYAAAWVSVAARAAALLADRRRIQSARVIDDDTLFPPEAAMPRSYTYRDSPLLTAALVRDYYAPLIRQGRTRPLPERIREHPAVTTSR